MPVTAALDGTPIAYDDVGPRDAPALLMIQGLGADRRGWVLQQAYFARRYRVITFDNRGAGRSGKPSGPYDLEVMATDAVCVLDACGIATAHVMGASMGGVIAQVLGVRHASRVSSLVLSCTGCHHLDWRRELLADWREVALEKGMGALAARALRWLVGPRNRRRLMLPAQLFGSALMNVPPHAFAAQVDAILSMPDDVRWELSSVGVPALVVVGTQDILTPLGDSEEIVERIPGAELHVLHGAAHAVMAEAPRAFNAAVSAFLDPVPVPAEARSQPDVPLPSAGA
jgi:3-oxoadipate enol-lactonase